MIWGFGDLEVSLMGGRFGGEVGERCHVVFLVRKI